MLLLYSTLLLSIPCFCDGQTCVRIMSNISSYLTFFHFYFLYVEFSIVSYPSVSFYLAYYVLLISWLAELSPPLPHFRCVFIIFMFVCKSMCVWICVLTFLCVCVYMRYVDVCVCVFVCEFVMRVYTFVYCACVRARMCLRCQKSFMFLFCIVISCAGFHQVNFHKQNNILTKSVFKHI